MNQLTAEQIEAFRLLRKEKLNKIKDTSNPDYIRLVFNENKDCEAIVSYENTLCPLDGKMIINRLHIKNSNERFEDDIKFNLLEEIARNQNTPIDILDQLVDIGYYRIVKMPHCPENLKQKITNLWTELSNDKTKSVVPPFMQIKMSQIKCK